MPEGLIKNSKDVERRSESSFLEAIKSTDFFLPMLKFFYAVLLLLTDALAIKISSFKERSADRVFFEETGISDFKREFQLIIPFQLCKPIIILLNANEKLERRLCCNMYILALEESLSAIPPSHGIKGINCTRRIAIFFWTKGFSDTKIALLQCIWIEICYATYLQRCHATHSM